MMSPIKRESFASDSDKADHALTTTPKRARLTQGNDTPTTKTKTKTQAKNDDTSSSSPTTPSHASKGRPGAKARLSPAAKIAIAEEIIAVGVAHLDVVSLAAKVGFLLRDVVGSISG